MGSVVMVYMSRRVIMMFEGMDCLTSLIVGVLSLKIYSLRQLRLKRIKFLTLKNFEPKKPESHMSKNQVR